MTTYSKADLRNRALSEIGVLDASEAASSEDADYVDRICQQMIEALDDENLLIFDSSTSVSTQIIPARVMKAMSAILAWEISPTYGRQRAPDNTPLMNALRRHVLQGQDPIPVVADYY